MVCVQIQGTQTPPELPPLSRALGISFCFRKEQKISKTNKQTNKHQHSKIHDRNKEKRRLHSPTRSIRHWPPGCWFVCRFDRREWSPWTQTRTSLHPSCPLWGTSGHWLSGWPWKEAWWNWCTCWGRSYPVVLHKGQHCWKQLEAALSTQPCHWPWSRYRWPGYWLCSPPVPACCPCHTVTASRLEHSHWGAEVKAALCTFCG